MKKQTTVSKIAFALGLGTLSFLFLVVTLTSIAFLFHGAVSLIWLILATFGSASITYWKLAKDKVSKPYLWVVLLLAAFVSSVAVSSQTLDSTWDGNDYHKTAIGEMKDGWNPVWEKMLDFHNSSRNPLYTGEKDQSKGYMSNWTDHYPKASWIFAANIYKATGNIESGKAITLLSMLILFCFALSFFLRYFEYAKSFILTSLLTFNPIVVTQIFNYYNDGVQGNLLLALLLLLTMFISGQPKHTSQQITLPITIVMTVVLAINFKFSGLAYVIIIATCYYLYLLFRRDWKLVKQLTLIGAISLSLGVLVVGSSSYVINTYRNHNPVFPLAGEGKLDIMTDKQPVEFSKQPALQKFIANNLYATANYDMFATDAPHLKIPFTIDMGELSVLHGTADARQAGYGVWFGGILIVSAIVGLYLLIRYGRRHKDWLPVILLPLVTIGITILAFDNTWWARYLPQLILLPVTIVIVLFALRAKVLPYILTFMLFFNVTLTSLLEINYQAAFNRESRAMISSLHCDDNKPATIGYGMFYGAVYNIHDTCNSITVTHQKLPDTSQGRAVQLYEGVYKITD